MSGPSTEELLVLLERQDDLVEILQSQVEISRNEIQALIREKTEKEEKLKETEARETEMRNELEMLKKSKGVTKYVTEAQSLDLDAVIELRNRCKEVEFELEREKMSKNAIILKMELEKTNFEQIRKNLERSLEELQNSEIQEKLKSENLTKEINECKAKLETSSSNYREDKEVLESRLEICKQREDQLNEHILMLNEEHAKLRQEKMTAMTRVTTMIEETAALRAKILRMSKTSDNFENDPKDIQKLLNDQSHLIAALREETKLLARKLEYDSKEYRSTIKKLKTEKRDLEERLNNLLRV